MENEFIACFIAHNNRECWQRRLGTRVLTRKLILQQPYRHSCNCKCQLRPDAFRGIQRINRRVPNRRKFATFE